MKEKEGGFEDMFKISSLFFADDGLILENSVENAEANIQELININKEYGLEINREKSHVIIWNMKEKNKLPK